MIQAQNQAVATAQAGGQASAPSVTPTSSLPYPVRPDAAPVYPGLGDFMGLELTEDVIRENMPEYLTGAANSVNQGQQLMYPAASSVTSSAGGSQMVAPLSSAVPAVAASQQLSHGIRQVVLCKDTDGKVGLRVKAVNKGVFVCLVARNSPAAMGGLRFGDQILQINGNNVAGFGENKVHDIFKRAEVNNIVLAVRDRPFERTVTLHKDSTGHLGFQYRDGKITAIVVNSSAARNGMLVDHNLLEVNGQNVVGIKDKEIAKIIDEADQIVTVTVIPNFLFKHMTANMSCSLIKKKMDHSIPDLWATLY